MTAARQVTGCLNKIQYRTRKKARLARKHVRPARGDARGAALNIYRCEFCSYYHIGHMPRSVRNGELDKAEWLSRGVDA